MDKTKLQFGKPAPSGDDNSESLGQLSDKEEYKSQEQGHVELIKQAIAALDAGNTEEVKSILQKFLPQEESETEEKPDFKSKANDVFNKHNVKGY